MINKISKKLRIRRRSVKKGGMPPITFTIFGEGIDNPVKENEMLCIKITELTENNTTADLYAAVKNRRPGATDNSPLGIVTFREYQKWQFKLYPNKSCSGLPISNDIETNLGNIPRTLFILNATQTEQEEFENQQRQQRQQR
jgi:hypothetical protein